MDGNDRLGLRRADVLDRLESHAPGLAVDVDDHRRGAAIEHRVDGRCKGKVRHDHFVARPDPKSDKRQVQGDGTVGHGDAVPDPHEVAELVLELLDVGSFAGDPAGDERVQHRAELMTCHMGFCDLHGHGRMIDQDAGETPAWIDHRLQYGGVSDIVAQPARRRRGAGVGQVPSQSRVNDRRAIEQGLTYVVERDAPSQALVVLDDQAGPQSVVETLLDDRKHAF
jgi:hypothetical protein